MDPNSAADAERLTYLLAMLRTSILCMAEDGTLAHLAGSVRLREVVLAVGSALGLAGGAEPCLWRSGMRPHIPHDPELAADQAELFRLSHVAQ